MDLTVDEYIEGLLSKEAYDIPSDSVKVDDLKTTLPKWFDEELYNRGRDFYRRYSYGFTNTFFIGLVAIFAVPSVVEVLLNTQRSTTKYTAYKRYLMTTLRTTSLFKHELKPGSPSWRSFGAIRKRHLMAVQGASIKNKKMISQRDLALTQFALFGFVLLKPDKFGIRQQREGDWDAYHHVWKVFGHMVGIKDRFNLCRNDITETRQACKQILDRVYTPLLENVPEYFEHLSHMMIEGLWAVNSNMEHGSLVYATKNLANVPGYILTEAERITLQTRIKEQLNGRHEDTGVDSMALVPKPGFECQRTPRLLYLKNYDSLDNAPEYRKLTTAAKYKMAIFSIMITFYGTTIGRFLLNWYLCFSLKMSEYFPYVAFFLYGIKNAYVDVNKESPTDDSLPKPNAYYYQPQPPEPWYKRILAFW
ncbi:uncharacterized protein [Battus philenor]|uniref:uncharacterized protein n=1 Tax=Battus philenor TaxID=42288 RepID=UPI0035CFF0D3